MTVLGRRTAAVALVGLVVLSGCAATDRGDTDPASAVPSGVDVVVTLDFDVLENDETETVVNTYLEETVPADSDTPRTLEGILERAREEADSNLTVDGLQSVAVFGRTPDQPAVGGVQPETQAYAGLVVAATWDREDVLESLRTAPATDEFREGDPYEDVTVYQVVNDTDDETTYVAEFEEGRWVFSTNRSVVTDVVDVAEGEREAFGGDLRSAYDRTREDAYLRYAATVSEAQRAIIGQAAERASEDSPVDLTQFSGVTAYSGAYYADDGQVGVSTYLEAEDGDTARRLNQTIGSLITLGKGTVEPGTPAETQLNALRTSREDRSVAVVYEIEVEALQELIREATDPGGTPAALAPLPLGPIGGDASPVPAVPAAGVAPAETGPLVAD